MGGRARKADHRIPDRWQWVTTLTNTQLTGYSALADRRKEDAIRRNTQDQGAEALADYIQIEIDRRRRKNESY